MDSYFIDVTTEFLSVAFHNVLYYGSVYPKSIFEVKRKYGIIVYHSSHPEVNEYIDNCLKCVKECLKNGNLYRIEFTIITSAFEPLRRFVFEVHKNEQFDSTQDAYLIQAEQNLRAFCLSLSSAEHKFDDLPEDCSFTIYLHTNESTAVALASNPYMENFPLVEISDKSENCEKIIPLRRIPIQKYYIDTYIEFKK